MGPVTQLSFTLPTVGNVNATEDPLLRTALSDLKSAHNTDLGTGGILTAMLASNSVTTAKITDANVTDAKLASGAALANLASASVMDAKLASPNNAAYRMVNEVGAAVIGTLSAGTYFFAEASSSATASGGATTGQAPAGLFYFDDADYTVAGLTQKLRIRQQVIVGGTSPSTVTLNCGLYPVTISAGNWTLGTVVPNSATSTTGLATNTISSFTSASGDFTIPADGAYCLGFVIGSITCPAGINISAQLQTRSV